MSFLDGTENMRLNNAILYREGRELMMKAYKGTVIRGFVFPHPELPDLASYKTHQHKEETYDNASHREVHEL